MLLRKQALANEPLPKLKALELGSGNGFLSICLAAAMNDYNLMEEIVVTDLSDHLPLMEQTISINDHIQKSCESKFKLIVKEHQWGKFSSESDEGVKYDFIFGSDVAYRDYLHEPLIASIKHYSSEHTISLIGVTMHDTKPKFFESLEEAGFVYDRIADHQMAPEFRGTTFGLFVIQKKSVA